MARRLEQAVPVALLAAGFLGATPAGAADQRLPPNRAAWTASPATADTADLDDLERAALARCGDADGGLQATARWVAMGRARGLATPDFDEVAFVQRAVGEPHPWARVWVASGTKTTAGATLASLDAWQRAEGASEAGGRASHPVRRCGVAHAVDRQGASIVAVVAVDAFADLAPLPMRARTGQWLTVEARLRVHAYAASVILLGPSGVPRSVPVSFDGTALRARVALDRPGEFTVQVVADLATGPRPVLEASIYADVEPPSSVASSRAPGEELAWSGADDDVLARMVSEARSSMGMMPLARDERLDALARSHALAMARAHALAHDVGDGGPGLRVRSAGFEGATGENVAHGASVALAHRATWMSPSHRSNLLRPEFDRIGIGAARDERGEVWAVEEFADARAGSRAR